MPQLPITTSRWWFEKCNDTKTTIAYGNSKQLTWFLYRHFQLQCVYAHCSLLIQICLIRFCTHGIVEYRLFICKIFTIDFATIDPNSVMNFPEKLRYSIHSSLFTNLAMDLRSKQMKTNKNRKREKSTSNELCIYYTLHKRIFLRVTLIYVLDGSKWNETTTMPK